MKIAIDCSQVIYGIGSSVYTKNLVANLLKLDHQNKYLLFGGSLRRQSDLRSFFSLFPRASSRTLPVSPAVADLLWNRVHSAMPIEMFIGRVDVLHSSDWTQPTSKAFKVTTVHDLWPILHPQQTHPKIVAVHRRRLAWVKEEVDSIIVPSIATKNDLIKYGYKEGKIHVVYEAPDPELVSSVKKNKNNMKNKYVLAVGASERKNTIRIVKAFQKFNKEGNYKLIIVGRPLDALNIAADNVEFTNHISNEKLRALYQGAYALVYPSLYEGFGLPILEAFANDCPVITSNMSSMAEIASDAAILVDPFDVKSIATALHEVGRKTDLLIKKGQTRVKSFSWEQAAKQTLEIYKQAI